MLGGKPKIKALFSKRKESSYCEQPLKAALREFWCAYWRGDRRECGLPHRSAFRNDILILTSPVFLPGILFCLWLFFQNAPLLYILGNLF